MRVGKLNWDELNYIINNHRGKLREEVEVSNGIGEDCAIIDFGINQCVISTDPVTGADENIGKIAVNINCNDIASCGVEPLGILVTILTPSLFPIAVQDTTILFTASVISVCPPIIWTSTLQASS